MNLVIWKYVIAQQKGDENKYLQTKLIVVKPILLQSSVIQIMIINKIHHYQQNHRNSHKQIIRCSITHQTLIPTPNNHQFSNIKSLNTFYKIQILLLTQMSQKQAAFWITFIAYAAIHALRMCYSFNKVNIRRQFNISQFYLGFLDAVLYISYGLGVFVRYQIFEGNSNMKKVYFITSILVSFCFGFVAYTAMFSQSSLINPKLAKLLLTLGIFLFGFFHLAFYQICGSVISGYYDSKSQSAKLGFWGASTSVGNIIGFFISNLAIHEFQLIWEVTFFLMGIFSLVMGFVVYYWLEVPKEDETYKQEIYALVSNNNQQKPNQHENSQIKYTNYPYQQIRFQHWLKFIQKVISTSPQARYTYAAYITTKATVYTFLMWFPIFLVSKNLQHVSGYISTLFDVGGTLGGYLIGKLHGASYDVENGNGKGGQSGCYRLLLKYRNCFLILVVALVIVAFILVEGSIAVYCPLTLLIGFFLGGSYNNVSSHEIFKIANNHMIHTDMLLNLSVGFSCFMVGLIQLITAFLLKWDISNNLPGQKTNYGMFFMVLLVLMVLCVGIMWMRARVVGKGEGKIQKKQVS